jgi:hypothetical protein
MIEETQGRKSPEDRIIKVNGHQLTFEELAHICVVYLKNEDAIYNKPWHRGGEMLKDFLIECMGERNVTPELLKKYNLDAEYLKKVRSECCDTC